MAGFLSVGATVLVLDDISLGLTNSGLKRGETGMLVAWEEDVIYVRFDTPHYDWPSQWRNELLLTREDQDVLGKLKFNPHRNVIDFYAPRAQVA